MDEVEGKPQVIVSATNREGFSIMLCFHIPVPFVATEIRPRPCFDPNPNDRLDSSRASIIDIVASHDLRGIVRRAEHRLVG